MLVLARRPGEKLVIGENVTITILDVQGKQIRIGIDAPREIAINREEIHKCILEERKGLNGALHREE